MAARPSGFQKQSLAVRLYQPCLWKWGVMQEWLHREYETDKSLSEQPLFPQPEPPSPAAAGAICRSTCQEQNANPHRRRCTRASVPASCVCACVCVCVAQQSFLKQPNRITVIKISVYHCGRVCMWYVSSGCHRGSISFSLFLCLPAKTRLSFTAHQPTTPNL